MSLMRIMAAVFVLAAATVLAQNSAERGIEVSDPNPKIAACDDFYEYANGGWRAANPIPSSMPRWSRRWAAGESTKEKLRAILEEISANKNHPKGSVEQLTGDFYSSCMDEAQANRLGVKPLEPLLAEIDRIRTRADVERMITRFHAIAIQVPFEFGGRPDNHNPADVIARIGAGGLGLPDRDYYVKTEPRFQEAREKYLAHVARIFTLAGYTEARARAAAETVFRLELQLARASLDNVQLRDPKATDNKMSFAALEKLTPNFDWKMYYREQALREGGELNVDEPKFLEEFNRLLAGGATVADWQTYLKWHLLNVAAPSLSDAFVQADFAFNGAYLRGAKELKPRWKRCVEATDNLLGEALGKKYVEKYFPPEAKARMQEMVKNLRTAM